MTDILLAPPFPRPPRWVRHALEMLRQAELSGLEPSAYGLLDRPWDPATCSPQVRRELWSWIDDVAGWLNYTYAWQTTHVVPSCWPAHPALVRELAVIACMRAAAADATVPHPMEEWHRYALPGFYARMNERQGMGCPPGRHVDWPARSWDADYRTPSAVAERRRRFNADIRDQSCDSAPDKVTPDDGEGAFS